MKRFFYILSCILITCLLAFPCSAADELEILLSYAEQGDPDAQYELALFYFLEEGNAEESEKWALKAAEQGQIDAQSLLGELYTYGDFYSLNEAEGVKWTKKAAQGGDMYSQFLLGNCYYFGVGVEQDYQEAFRWYSMSADQGNPDAYYAVGVCYEFGDCAELDLTEAANWFRKGADEGHDGCQTNLGLIYLDGIGVEQDNNEAVKWLYKAAVQGNEDAADALDRILNEGITIPGKLYTFEENDSYEYSSAKKYQTIADADISVGAFVLTGTIKDKNQRNSLLVYDVASGDIQISYRYLDDLLIAMKDEWHYVRDDSNNVDGLTLSKDIRKGALILLASEDGKNWNVVYESENTFSETPVNVEPFYEPGAQELTNGTYYRAIILYKLQKNDEVKKHAEIYDFYLYDSDSKHSSQVIDTQAIVPTEENVQLTPTPDMTAFVQTLEAQYTETALAMPTDTPEPVYTEVILPTATQLPPTAVPTQLPYYFPSEPTKMEKDSGYSKVETIGINDVHYGWKIGDFLLSGYTQVVTDPDDGSLVFLKTTGDKTTLYFHLNENINKLRGEDKLFIDIDENGYDQYFQIERTNFGQGTLIIRRTDSTNKQTAPQIYTNYLAANAKQSANTKVEDLEEGDYEIALDYSIKEKGFISSISDYRVSFTFKVRTGNCMIYLFDVDTENSLSNRATASKGFRVDTANSKYLEIEVKKRILDDNGLDLVLSPDFNKVVRDKQEFRDNGVYDISVHNKYTGAETNWTVYVGTDKLLKAYIVTGLEPREIQQRLDNGYIITDDGYLITPTPTATPTATFTPTPTATFTSTPTLTASPTPTFTAMPTSTPTAVLPPTLPAGPAENFVSLSTATLGSSVESTSVTTGLSSDQELKLPPNGSLRMNIAIAAIAFFIICFFLIGKNLNKKHTPSSNVQNIKENICINNSDIKLESNTSMVSNSEYEQDKDSESNKEQEKANTEESILEEDKTEASKAEENKEQPL